MTPLVNHYGTAKHRSYGLICQNIAILFQGVRVGFKCTTFLRSLTASDFFYLILESSSAILEAIFYYGILALVITVSAQV